MKSMLSGMRIAALLLLALGLMSCGNATNYGGPPGTTGSLAVTPTSIDIGAGSIYAGGDVYYFVATGGTPPYYWYQSNTAVGLVDPLDEGDDGAYRRMKYTTKAISEWSAIEDTITLIDQVGDSATATISITLALE